MGTHKFNDSFSLRPNLIGFLRRDHAKNLRFLETHFIFPSPLGLVRAYHNIQDLIHIIKADSGSTERLLEIDIPTFQAAVSFSPHYINRVSRTGSDEKQRITANPCLVS